MSISAFRVSSPLIIIDTNQALPARYGYHINSSNSSKAAVTFLMLAGCTFVADDQHAAAFATVLGVGRHGGRAPVLDVLPAGEL